MGDETMTRASRSPLCRVWAASSIHSLRSSCARQWQSPGVERMPAYLFTTLVILLSCAATNLAGSKCKYGARVSRLQVTAEGLVSWSAPKAPAACAEAGWRVCAGLVGPAPHCSVVPMSSRSLQLEGLLPCRWHNISVAAVGTLGQAAAILFFMPGLPATDVPLVAEPKMLLVQPNRVVVTFNETGSSQETCFSHYTACWSANGSAETCKRKRGYEALETGRLQLCSNYTFRFWTSVLDSVNSSYRSLAQFTGAGDVRDMTITTVSSNSIGIRWQPPSPEGDCVDHYWVEHDSGIAKVAANTTEHLVTDLLPCKHYFVQVHAVSAHGTLSNAVRRRAITRPSLPGVVTDMRVEWTSSRRVLVRWVAPADTRFCHVRYSVCWRKSGVDNERCARRKLSPYPSHVIGKLKPCTEYTVKVAVLGAEKVLGDAASIRAVTGPEPVAGLRTERLPAGPKVLRWEAPPCAVSYQVCWGAWGGAGSHHCANTTSTSFALAEGDPRLDTFTYSVVALGPSGASSDRALAHVAF
ncbi:receptor-type tyrosine-protein phosphatase H-like [Bacillus rossius redtenbacheri]|uniref:receptor-type tyrosine-protein phosphatase H-like n=1 Tax=Bacillus rossius redtenbacheri TaxID=93214 RepID=UPI002FDCB15F